MSAPSPAETTATAGDWSLPSQHAQAPRRVTFVLMTEAELDAVSELEKRAYAHPWSRRHFQDSLSAAYPVVLLLGEARPGEAALPGHEGRVLLGYLVAMRGVDEVHLLNITVSPDHRRQGWARLLLDALVFWSRGQGAQCLWLEVREGNAPARALYRAYGFSEVGLRKAYYPGGGRERENAVVMSLPLAGAPAGEGA